MASEEPTEAQTTGEGIVPLSLDELKACNVGEMAKDKFKSRQLQRSLGRGGPEHAELIFGKTEPHINELVCDQHGNYLIQKLMEVVKDEQFDIVFNRVKGDLISMAKDSHGTRAVQKIVEQAIARKRVDQLMKVLPADTAEELARHITGFHVVVKLLESLPSENANELLDRLCGTPEKVESLGKDQWGCCVLKKCIDRTEGQMKEKLVDSIASHAMTLVQDAFGNYVVQHLVLSKPNNHVGRVIDSLKGNVFTLSLQKFSSNVLEKCLANSPDKDRNKIINEILNPPDGQKPSEAVRKLLFHQFGNYVIQQALEVAKDPQFSLLIEHSKQHIQELYIEATKQQAQTREPAPTAGGFAGGNLPAEHSHRLAVKLVKKYPALTEGMDMGNVMPGMEAAWMFDYDPMGFGLGYFGVDPYGVDPYGYPMPFDPYSMQFSNLTFPVATGGKGGRGGGKGQKANRGAKKSASSSQGAAKGAAKGADGGDTVKVGRIVGFWPHYTYVEEDVPGATPNRPNAKRKPKSKAAAKGKQKDSQPE